MKTESSLEEEKMTLSFPLIQRMKSQDLVINPVESRRLVRNRLARARKSILLMKLTE